MADRSSQIKIPENYKYLLERAFFELNRSCNNAAFMLSRHLEDADASYLDSEEWKGLQDRAVSCQDQSFLIQMAVVMSMLGENNFPDKFMFSTDNNTLFYVTNDK